MLGNINTTPGAPITATPFGESTSPMRKIMFKQSDGKMQEVSFEQVMTDLRYRLIMNLKGQYRKKLDDRLIQDLSY